MPCSACGGDGIRFVRGRYCACPQCQKSGPAEPSGWRIALIGISLALIIGLSVIP